MHTPLITDVNERIDTRSFWFKIGDKTEVYRSCSVTFQGRSYVYGGYTEQTQLSMVDECALKRIATLPFAFKYGACTSTPDQVFLCFELGSDHKTCRTGQSATGPFVEIEKSLYDHLYIRIAASNGKLYK